MNTLVCNPIFYMHLIATMVTIFFVIVIWWTNRKIMLLNKEVIKDNIEILVEAKKLQDRMNNIEKKEK